MRKNRHYFRLIILALFLPVGLSGQDYVLDQYIQQGLESNLALQQKQLSYNKSLAALKEARGLFFPDISFNARYSVADGGRTIDFPVGDLLNPVYTTLNQILMEDRFPMVENEKIYFLRPTEQETKISLVQPIINPQIAYNYRIKEDLSEAAAIGIEVYKRELVAEIKKAYLQYMQALAVDSLYDQTLVLVKENLRTNNRLYENDKLTIDAVYRAESEVSKVEQRIAEAEKNIQLAASWFNFLLNRPLDSEIKKMTFDDPGFQLGAPKQYEARALEQREELRQMDAYLKAREQSIKLNKSGFYPNLIAAIDYGIQGEEYSFTDKDDYVLASLVLRWNIFSGNQRRAKVRQASIEAEMLEKKNAELEKQIALQVIESYYDLIAARKAIAASKDEMESADKAFRLVNKKYEQGQIPLIEYIDARTTKTNAGINHILKKYDYLIKYADFERATNQYQFNKQKSGS